MEAIWPPTQCRHCNLEGAHNFYKDMTQTITYRCRLCGTEHYEKITKLTGQNPKVGGKDI